MLTRCTAHSFLSPTTLRFQLRKLHDASRRVGDDKDDDIANKTIQKKQRNLLEAFEGKRPILSIGNGGVGNDTDTDVSAIR